MSAAGSQGSNSYGQGPQLGGGPAPIQQPQQPDTYTAKDGLPGVDRNATVDVYQPPTFTTGPTPGGANGKGGFPQGPQLGGGPAPFDPNTPNPLGPEGQTPTVPQQNAGQGGGKSMSGFGNQGLTLTQDQVSQLANILFKQ